jgi:hypothetical protein
MTPQNSAARCREQPAGFYVPVDGAHEGRWDLGATKMINLWAVAVATVAAFVASSVYYTAFDKLRATLLGTEPAANERPPAWKVGAELARSLVIAASLAVAVARLDVDGAGAVLLLALGVWLAFPVTILTGSVVWDDVPWRLAAIHAGDWLVKAVLIALLVGLWR